MFNVLLLFVGQFIMGAGGTPVYTLGKFSCFLFLSVGWVCFKKETLTYCTRHVSEGWILFSLPIFFRPPF